MICNNERVTSQIILTTKTHLTFSTKGGEEVGRRGRSYRLYWTAGEATHKQAGGTFHREYKPNGLAKKEVTAKKLAKEQSALRSCETWKRNGKEKGMKCARKKRERQRAAKGNWIYLPMRMSCRSGAISPRLKVRSL